MKNNTYVGSYPDERWPGEFSELNPESVRIEKNGVYIVMHGFFVSESGVYIPANGMKPDTANTEDPAYNEINDNVYWYEIKG